MNQNYKRLMNQYGGSVPFSMIGGVNKDKNKKTSKPKRKPKRKSKGKRTKRKSMIKYAVGTILRRKDGLYKLNADKKWIKL